MPSAVRGAAGANLPAVRDHNAALVLDLVRSADGISRVELAGRTGLTAQAITKIVNRLRADGLVTETGRAGATGGKPRTLLRLDPAARHAVGVHLDRADTTVVVADLTGRTVARRHVAHGMTAGPQRTLDSMAGLVRAALAEAGAAGADPADPADADQAAGWLLGVGIACPGPLDHGTGVLHRVTGLPAWDGFPLRAAAAELLGTPTVVDKDTNAAALGETLSGVALPGSFAYVYHGRGLGAGLVLNGRVHRGRRTLAGEFGHQIVQLDGPPCPCGNRGCLEALCRAAVDAGDLAGAARLIGIAAANLVRLLDLEHIVLGGPVSLAAAELYPREVAAAVASHLPEPDRQTVGVTLSAAGADAVATGAAALMLTPLFDVGDGKTLAGCRAGRASFDA
ncbi:ROK family protein [Krasilnikovia sp. MM14-A1259]|uniref:ROK family transcriptional regulator n=1 Tax=Krasilnikovia sp. MM14-A1259 TaxID=3373539 RepID=UPI00380FDCA9